MYWLERYLTPDYGFSVLFVGLFILRTLIPTSIRHLMKKLPKRKGKGRDKRRYTRLQNRRFVIYQVDDD